MLAMIDTSDFLLIFFLLRMLYKFENDIIKLFFLYFTKSIICNSYRAIK